MPLPESADRALTPDGELLTRGPIHHSLPPEPNPDGAAPVPEPGALFLVGTGLLGVAVTARLRRRPRPTTD